MQRSPNNETQKLIPSKHSSSTRNGTVSKQKVPKVKARNLQNMHGYDNEEEYMNDHGER